MRKSQYDKLLELLTTLFQATEILLNMSNNDAQSELVGNIKNFVNAILQYINSQNLEQTCIRELLLDFLNILEKPDNETALIETLNQIDSAFDKVTYENISSELLQSEDNFSQYIDLLKQATEEGLCIFIAVDDTPCGSPNFTYELGEKLCEIGLDINLYDKWRCSYCAILDGKTKIAEKISDSHSVELTHMFGDTTVSLKSVAMGIPKEFHSCSIEINNAQVALNRRGITFVIYNKLNSIVLDSVTFDTYLAPIPGFHDMSTQINQFILAHPEVAFVTCKRPIFPRKNLTAHEQYIADNLIEWRFFLENPKIADVLLNYVGDEEGVQEVLTQPPLYRGGDGARYFKDYKSRYLNCINGHRVTIGQPKHFKRTIYIVGDCVALGIGVRDEGTYASRLQRLLNENAVEEELIVENYGMGLLRMDDGKEILATLKSLPLKSGDIVIGIGNTEYPENPEFNVRPCKYGEIFLDRYHLTEGGHRLVAEGLFNTLKENNFFREKASIPKKVSSETTENTRDYGFSSEQLEELEHYKEHLSILWKEKMGQSENVGAIVMNCNPFTLGHRYLIEECSKKCEYLIIFVVQEDKSVFPFEDRIKLVQDGVSDLKNVFVIGSGQFIISSLTFIGYFNKTELQDRVVDSSDDVTIFVREIAPAAHIKVRFVGTEPLDHVTNQYNRTLEAMLPCYGIRFQEIERKQLDGEVISASRVRKLLETNDWDTIRKIVPDVTFSYLQRKYEK